MIRSWGHRSGGYPSVQGRTIVEALSRFLPEKGKMQDGKTGQKPGLTKSKGRRSGPPIRRVLKKGPIDGPSVGKKGKFNRNSTKRKPRKGWREAKWRNEPVRKGV